MALDAKALTMLGELRADIKWLVQATQETHLVKADHERRINKLEAGHNQTESGTPWLTLLQIALGLLPLLAALLGRLPWKEAFELSSRTTGA